MSDLRAAHAHGYLARVPHYNSIFNYPENPDVTPILKSLIVESSLPLKAVEVDFAADSPASLCRASRAGSTTSRVWSGSSMIG